MKVCRNLVLLGVLAAASWAAERIVVHRVQLAGPMGTDTGHLIATGDRLIFVDDVDPSQSFSIPKTDIDRLNYENGVLTLHLTRPFSGMFGSRSDVVVRLQDPAASQVLSDWLGLPLTGATSERSRAADVATATQVNVTHDGDEGRLIIAQNGIEWQDLKNTDKSRRWSYSEIKSFTRDRDEHELKLKTYSGEEFKFKVSGADLADDVFNMIADRIVQAKRQ